MEEVLITLKSRQKTPDDDESTELMTTGHLEVKEGELTLSYEDTETTGYEGSVTRVTVKDGELVTVIRSGTASSNLIVEQGKKHFCLYETPFGTMTIGVQGKSVVLEQGVKSGRLKLSYQLDINASYLSDNFLEMHWVAQES